MVDHSIRSSAAFAYAKLGYYQNEPYTGGLHIRIGQDEGKKWQSFPIQV